jgi:hypothetical protein
VSKSVQYVCFSEQSPGNGPQHFQRLLRAHNGASFLRSHPGIISQAVVAADILETALLQDSIERSTKGLGLQAPDLAGGPSPLYPVELLLEYTYNLSGVIRLRKIRVLRSSQMRSNAESMRLSDNRHVDTDLRLGITSSRPRLAVFDTRLTWHCTDLTCDLQRGKFSHLNVHFVHASFLCTPILCKSHVHPSLSPIRCSSHLVPNRTKRQRGGFMCTANKAGDRHSLLVHSGAAIRTPARSHLSHRSVPSTRNIAAIHSLPRNMHVGRSRTPRKEARPLCLVHAIQCTGPSGTASPK